MSHDGVVHHFSKYLEHGHSMRALDEFCWRPDFYISLSAIVHHLYDPSYERGLYEIWTLTLGPRRCRHYGSLAEAKAAKMFHGIEDPKVVIDLAVPDSDATAVLNYRSLQYN